MWTVVTHDQCRECVVGGTSSLSTRRAPEHRGLMGTRPTCGEPLGVVHVVYGAQVSPDRAGVLQPVLPVVASISGGAGWGRG